MVDLRTEARCLTCGGELETRRFHDAWTDDTCTTPSVEDCTEGLYCHRCQVVWIAFVKDEGDLKDSVPV